MVLKVSDPVPHQNYFTCLKIRPYFYLGMMLKNNGGCILIRGTTSLYAQQLLLLSEKCLAAKTELRTIHNICAIGEIISRPSRVKNVSNGKLQCALSERVAIIL